MVKFDESSLGEVVREITIETVIEDKYIILHAELLNSEGEIKSRDRVRRLSIESKGSIERLKVSVYGRAYAIAVDDIESVLEYPEHIVVHYGHGEYQNLRLVLQKYVFND